MESNLFLGPIYLAGLLSFFSPCIFPIIPIYFGILTGGEKNSVIKTILFILGLSTSFLLLGFSAGFLGSLLVDDRVRIAMGIFVIFMGIVQAEFIKIKALERTKLLSFERDDGGYISSYLLGFGFSLGWTPCVGPILTSILVISSGGANASYGAFLMFIYVLGLMTPFIVISFSSKYFLKKLNFVKKYLSVLKKIGGVLIILMGVLLLTNQLNIFL